MDRLASLAFLAFSEKSDCCTKDFCSKRLKKKATDFGIVPLSLSAGATAVVAAQ